MQVQLHDLGAVPVAGVARRCSDTVDLAVDGRSRSSIAASIRLTSNVRVAEPVPEREGRRSGRCSTRSLRRASGAARYVDGCAPGVARHADRQPPARVDPAAEHAGDRARCPPRRGRTPARSPRRAVAARAERVRPAGEQHRRRSACRCEHGVEQLLLGAGQREAPTSQPSPLVPRPNRPARSPRASTTTSADAASRRGLGECRRSRRRRRWCPARTAISAAGELGAQRLEQRRAARCPMRHLGMLHPDVRRERVAAEHRRTGRRRSGRSPRSGAGAASGSTPSLRSSTTASSASRRASARLLGGVEVDRAAQRLGRRRGRRRASAGGTGDQSASSRPSSAFCRSTRRSARSTSASSTRAVLDRRDAAARRRPSPSAARRRCRPRARRAAASPRSPATPCSVLAGTRPRSSRRRRCRRSPTSSRSRPVSSSRSAADGHAVDVGVGVHDRARAAVADRHLERRQQHVGELARPDRDRREVAPGPRGRVADEVLEGGDDAGRLAARARRRCRSVPTRYGSSPMRLLDAAPARRRARRRAPGRAPGARRPSACRRRSARAISLDELGVEGRAPGQRHRVGGRAPGGEAGEALLVRDRRDAEPARRDDALLRAQQRERRRPPGRPARCRTAG